MHLETVLSHSESCVAAERTGATGTKWLLLLDQRRSFATLNLPFEFEDCVNSAP
jgi:hypothetical protein